ncbi:hypothetical protein [Pyxidicoccus trucidator]|uniref:hypothetical protein n=1 Tax=Pyxidicoccus trucidator TaxID=2709662 RepID=UPI0013D99469|nr:hypothetical protein [Pyxidicoccus trucidator]
MSRFTRGLLALLLACTVSCGDDGTSLFLRVEGADSATQLEVRGLREGEPWFGPERRPEQEGTPFSGEQTLRLRFNAPPDVPFQLEVDALANGVPIARVVTEAVPRKGREVELRLQLSPVSEEPPPDGGTPDGGSPDGGEPDAGESDAGEPDGGGPDGGEPDAGSPDSGTPDAGSAGCTTCLLNGACVAQTSAVACGGSGVACVDCTTDGRATVCTAGGACSCGTRGTPCGAGERCEGNACVCDPDTCAGCCDTDGTDCRTGSAMNACGTQGVTCVDCSQLRADNCSPTGCRCGTSAPCGLLTCRSGQCTL